MELQNNMFNEFKDAAAQEQTEPLPRQNQLWERIEARLNEEKQERRLWAPTMRYIAAAVVLIAGISVVWQYTLRDQQDTIRQTHTSPIRAEGHDVAVANPQPIDPLPAPLPVKHKTRPTRRSTKNVSQQNRIATLHEKQLTQPERAGTTLVAGQTPYIHDIPMTQEQHSLIKNDSDLTHAYVFAPKIDKHPYTGSINTISRQELAKRPVVNVAAALNNAAPGLDITGGQPGAAPDIIIRGNGSLSTQTTPLIVVNGALYTGTLQSIDPLDVISITVLKDVSAQAIYGSRAANGVILIKTKKQRSRNRLWNHLFHKKKKRQAEPTPPAAEVLPPASESYIPSTENPFISPENQPKSTFSIDVDRASYAQIRRFLTNGQAVPQGAIRIEEMINYFSYQYPQPTSEHPFSIHTEYSDAPWNPGHRLLKIGLQGRSIPNEAIPASNLVFLIDVSGSMNEENKLPYVKESLKILTRQLRKKDRIAIVVYAGAAGLVLPSTSGAQKTMIMNAIDQLHAGGSTAGGAGIELAYQVATEHFIPDGNNRIILATDGDFNIGASSDQSMQALIEEKRKNNIFLTCLGFGQDNYKDSKMELLADKGNGHYAYIDNLNEATKVLQHEFGGTLLTIAKDVKIQIEFNPEQVAAYRLIGYENRLLTAAEFANDTVDAGEMGSGHSVTALYELIPKGSTSAYMPSPQHNRYTRVVPDHTLSQTTELAHIQFRYKKPNSTQSQLIDQVVPNRYIPLSQSSRGFKLAASVAWFGLQLRHSQLIRNNNMQLIRQLAQQAVDPHQVEEAELLRLMEIAP